MRSHVAVWLLAALVLAPSSVRAVALNPRGIGSVLLYPYYTVNRGQDTLVSLVNTADTAKLARVRFLEGYNGRTVLETYVFLSAHDVWTAVVAQVADDGGAKLVSSDRTCTYPVLTPEREAFVSSDYDGVALHSGDTGPTSITRTREGSIEIIEAADIVPGSTAEAAITHVQDGTPGGGVPPCHFAGGPGSQPVPIADLAPPTGGLFGSASIVDIAQGTFFAYDATALADFTDRVLVTDFREPGEATLADAHSSESNRTARAHLPEDHDVLAVDFDEGIDAVTALFMSETLSNDLTTVASLGANTDWVVGFPTKRFYVDERLSPNAREPFLETFGEHVQYDNSRIRGVSRIGIQAYIYDRDELMTTTRDQEQCGFICPVQPPLYLSYQTNVIAFGADGTASNTPSRVLGSVLSLYYRAGYGQPPRPDAGWMLLDITTLDPFGLDNGINEAGEAVYQFGMPAIGFMAYNIVNANAQPGVLGNYGGAFAHRATTCRNTDGMPCFLPLPLPN